MKNPWMSMWLSAANKSAGAARGQWMAEAQRQQTAFMKAATKPPGRKATAKKSTAKRRAK